MALLPCLYPGFRPEFVKSRQGQQKNKEAHMTNPRPRPDPVHVDDNSPAECLPECTKRLRIVKSRAGRQARYVLGTRVIQGATEFPCDVQGGSRDQLELGIRRLRELTVDLRRMLGIEAERD
jgi:hypothetical protein